VLRWRFVIKKKGGGILGVTVQAEKADVPGRGQIASTRENAKERQKSRCFGVDEKRS